jgi:hypothetical protein
LFLISVIIQFRPIKRILHIPVRLPWIIPSVGEILLFLYWLGNIVKALELFRFLSSGWMVVLVLDVQLLSYCYFSRAVGKNSKSLGTYEQLYSFIFDVARYQVAHLLFSNWTGILSGWNCLGCLSKERFYIIVGWDCSHSSHGLHISLVGQGYGYKMVGYCIILLVWRMNLMQVS